MLSAASFMDMHCGAVEIAQQDVVFDFNRGSRSSPSEPSWKWSIWVVKRLADHVGRAAGTYP
jgi:hypothetical protein